MNDGSITGNTASYAAGVYNDSDFVMNGGSIAKNTADYFGGGVANTDTFTMKGGSITENTAGYVGGGVYNYGTFAMTGGSITKNKVTESGDEEEGITSGGGGIYNLEDVNLSGTVTITGNTVAGNTNNLCLVNTGSLNPAITADANIANASRVGINAYNPSDGLTVLSGSTSTTVFTSDDTNYMLVDNGSNGLKLSEGTVKITGVTLKNAAGGDEMTDGKKVYDGKAVAYTEGTCTPGVEGVTLTYTWQEKTDGIYNNIEDNVAPSDAGEYQLMVTANKDGSTLATLKLPFVITAKALTVSLTAQDKTYDGSTSATASGSLTGVVGDDKVTVKVSNAAFEYKNVGTDKTVTADISLEGDDAGNYSAAATATAVANITAREVSITGVTVENSKVYDGNNSAVITGDGTIDGKVSSDDLTIIPGTAAYDDKNAGKDKTVTFTGFALDGDDKANYLLKGQPASTTASITEKEISITGATVEPKTYDGDTDATLTNVDFNGLLDGETLTFGTDYTVSNAKYDKANATGSDAASLVTFTVTLGDTLTAKNYKLTDTTGTQAATISKASTSDITEGQSNGIRGEENTYEVPSDWIVNGGAVSVLSVIDESSILDGTPAYDNGKLTYKLKNSATDGQKAEITLKVTSDNYEDYTIKVTVTVSAKEELEITVTAGEYVYNGSAQTPTDIKVSGDKVPVSELVMRYVGVDGTVYDSTDIAPSKAGKYTLTVSIPDTNTRYYGTATCSFEIEPKTLTAAVEADDKTYDGETDAYVVVTLKGGVLDDDDVNSEIVSAVFDNKNVGNNKTVTVNVKLEGDDVGNYILKEQSVSTKASITAKEVSITGTAVQETKVYDGSKSATITNNGTIDGKISSDDLTIKAGTASYDNKNAGNDKTVTFTGFALDGTDKDNYKLTGQPASTTASITAKEVSITGTAVQETKVYDGSKSATITNNGTIDGKISSDDLTIKAGTASYDNKNAGNDKTVTFTGFALDGTDKDNYKLTGQPASTTANITKKEISITGTAVQETKVYDGGNSATITNNGTIDGKVSSDDLKVKVGTAAYNDKNAGKDKTVTFTGFGLEGDDKANYLLKGQPASTTANITEKEISITGATVEPKTYDGDTDATLTNVDFSGLLDGETLTFGTDYTVSDAKYDKANATGSDAASLVTFNVTLGDTLTAKNYKLTDTTGTQAASISKASTSDITEGQSNGIRGEENTYEVPSDWIVNGGAVSVLSVIDESSILDGTPAYDNGKLTYKLKNSATDGQKAEITLKVTSDNYEDYTIKVTVTVSAKEELEITVTAGEYVYNGSAQTPTDIKVSGDKVPVSELVMRYVGVDGTVYDSTDTAPSKAGKYTLTVSIPDTNTRYYGTATCSFEIEPKTLTVSATAKDKTYDGSTSATVSAELNGVVGKDKVTVKVSNAAFNNKNVGTNKKVTADISLEGDDSGNYALKEQSVKTRAGIEAKEVTITGVKVESSKYYDGSDAATITERGTIDDKVSGDDLTIKAGTARYDSKDVGTGKEVTFTGFGLEGRDAGNYLLKGQPASVKADIIAYIADGTEYSVNSNDWINTDFVITAEKDWQLSLTNTAEGSWVNTLTESQETDKGTITFYVRNKTTGVISEIITELYKIDKTAPVISGADEGKTYCAAVTLTINESHLDKVTVNGAAATLTDDKLILEPAEGEQTVIARDKAGNETGITVTVNDGHTWGEWESNGNGTHTRICKIDPDHTETADCSGGEATCVEQAKCDICGAGYGELNPDNHSDLIHVAAKAPTTTEEGNIEYWYCKGCGKYYRDAETTQEITKEDTVIAKLPPESDDSDDSGSSKGQDSSGSSGESSNQGNSGTSAGSGSSASTGDNSNLMLWLVIMLVCGAGTAGTALSGKKKKRSK